MGTIYLGDIELSQNSYEAITYSDLVDLRDNGKLTPSCWYRITDYECTTTQENTQSAGNQFDILVQATDVNVLNENARAIKHSGDTYFSASTLDAWELKYCLDNDTDRFQWADSTNGKGVIYYMKDEFNNECPYDFKNIQYVFVQGFTVTYQTYGTRTKVYGRNTANDQTINGLIYYGWSKIAEPSSGGVDLPNDYWTVTLNLSTNMDRYVISSGTVTKNTNGVIESFVNSPFTTFTFDHSGIDASISGFSEQVTENSIAPYVADNKYLLNVIYFRSTSYLLHAYSNSFNANCHDMSFDYGCYSNTFGTNNYKDSFGNTCYNNTFGNSCFGNLFGNNCYDNTFGNNCYSNTFEDYCDRNSFVNSCQNNSFGNYCQNNSFVDNNYRNSFGNYFQYNSFGNNCEGNSFRNYCYNNTFGNSCNYNYFGNNCGYNSFGDSCQNNSFGNDCQYIHFLKDYTWYIIVENGNKYIDVTSTQSTSSSSKLRNFTITQGVNTDGTSSTKKTISHDTVNDTFKTTYQPTNSQVVSV